MAVWFHNSEIICDHNKHHFRSGPRESLIGVCLRDWKERTWGQQVQKILFVFMVCLSTPSVPQCPAHVLAKPC